jgi:hypothetical protein
MAKESQELTEDQIIELLLPHVEDLLSKRTCRLSVAKMKAWLKVEEGIVLSPWKTRIIKNQMEIQHRKIFDTLNDSEKAERVYVVPESSALENQSKDGTQPGSETTEASENKK